MFKKPSFVIALLAALLLVCSCDWVRGLAGRPGSAEIAERRELIARKEKAEKLRKQAAADSALRAQKAIADSLAAVDSIASEGIKLYPSVRMGGIVGDTFNNKYCVIIGSFSNPSNASKLIVTASQAGYQACSLRFGKGLYAVGIDATDKIASVYASYKRLRQEPFCPDGIWILTNEN